MKTRLFISSFLCLQGLFAQNIGINTPTPNAALDVRSTGSTSATYGVLVSNTTNDTSLVVSDNGNVGIGTTLPAYTLDVQSTNPIAARFSGRVTGQNAVNANEFITLQQAGTLGGSGSQAAPTQFSAPNTSDVNFISAILYCRNLSEGGNSDWRMPTESEFLGMLANDAVALPTFANSTHYWLNSGISYNRDNYYGELQMKLTFYHTSSLAGSYMALRISNSTTGRVICVR